MIALQITMTFLVAALGAVALFDGRIIVGVLLLALASARVWMIVERRRRRAELTRRFRGDGGPDPLLNPSPVRPTRAVGCPETHARRGTRVAATEIEERGINVIRGLAMDAVQKANSGHPGTPMALAPLAHVL